MFCGRRQRAAANPAPVTTRNSTTTMVNVVTLTLLTAPPRCLSSRRCSSVASHSATEVTGMKISRYQ